MHFVIFQVEGGLGKSIMATAVVKGFKKKYPKSNIIVTTPYPDVFLNNPDIYKVYNFGEGKHFYQRYIKDKEVEIRIQDPYSHNNFQTNKEHLLETWFKMFELEYEDEQPEIFLTKVEKEHHGQFYKTDKPILVLHTNGGPPGTGIAYNWVRDMPEALVFQLIEHYKKDYTIVQIRREDQLMYPDALSALDGFRSLSVMLQMSQKRILIDSFAQHVSAALVLPSTVLWIGTKPEVFGYDIHKNIKANPFTKEPNLDNALYQPFSLTEPLTTIPYNDTREIFNIDSIIK